MEIANKHKNDKYIGYDCVCCLKKINENERQRIIALGTVQTWCLLCLAIKYPTDKWLQEYVSKGNTVIIDRNKLLNNEG